jgi:hypothetical protein
MINSRQSNESWWFWRTGTLMASILLLVALMVTSTVMSENKAKRLRAQKVRVAPVQTESPKAVVPKPTPEPQVFAPLPPLVTKPAEADKQEEALNKMGLTKAGGSSLTPPTTATQAICKD